MVTSLDPNTVSLPADLLQAVAIPGGGTIALVLGAGCSVEAPTSVPTARSCSEEVHRRLVADGVLQNGDCEDPSDLSRVTDAVFNSTGSQRDVVDRLRAQYDLKLATPNTGYLVAAAMLCEGVISSVVTLNFDLALTTALSELGAGAMIGVVECPDDLARQKNTNVYYLHRNANTTDPDLWVLRTAALKDEWRGCWEQVIATKALTAPIVVFAGLGTPVSVLIESTRLIRQALPDAKKIYQVDPGGRETSAVFLELAIAPSNYVQAGWCQFMENLSQRLVEEQLSLLRQAAQRKIHEDGIPNEDVTNLLARLRTLGLIELGKLRAHWLLHDKPYCQAEVNDFGLLADLLLALALIARVSGAVAVIMEEGIVEFHRDGRAVAAYLIVSGRGHRGRVAVEAIVGTRLAHYRGRYMQPHGAIVGGTSDSWATPNTPPDDIVRGDESREDIVVGPSTFPLLHIDQFRANSQSACQVVP